MMHDHEETQRVRQLAKLTRELLKGQQFVSRTDLADAVHERCHALGLRVTHAQLASALALIESNTPLTVMPSIVRPRPSERVRDVTAAMTHLDAVAALANAGLRVVDGRLVSTNENPSGGGDRLVEIR